MADITVPALGNEVEEGVVVEWLKKPGDKVVAGEPIVVIGTPKLNFEVEAPVSGVLGEPLAVADEIVPVGAMLSTIDES
jgi:pyruvate/2-oxoglutarate dehydrogenase complex dihydrolipoamide acyltransferase (E2) component